MLSQRFSKDTPFKGLIALQFNGLANKSNQIKVRAIAFGKEREREKSQYFIYNSMFCHLCSIVEVKNADKFNSFGMNNEKREHGNNCQIRLVDHLTC